jgi:hypothetical protein
MAVTQRQAYQGQTSIKKPIKRHRPNFYPKNRTFLFIP